MSNKLRRIALYVFIPIFLIMLNASFLTTKAYLNVSKGHYESHQYIVFDHDYVADRIMGYLNYEYDDILIGLNAEDDVNIIFRDTEIRHMEDVKDLYTTLRIISISGALISAGIIIFMVKKKDYESITTVLKNMWKYPMFFVVFIGAFMIIDFNSIFTIFHHLFFTNDDWLLYYTDVLIQLLPSAFWMVSGLIILVLFVLELFGLRWLGKHLEKKHSM